MYIFEAYCPNCGKLFGEFFIFSREVWCYTHRCDRKHWTFWDNDGFTFTGTWKQCFNAIMERSGL